MKQGYIVDLGPVGKLYPSCSSGWVEKAEDLQLSSVTPSIYYRPAIKGATLQWAKETEEDKGETPDNEEDDNPPLGGD